MIHRCKVECHKHDATIEELTGSRESVWLPFSFLYDTVVAIKEASNDPEDANYNCTTLYMEGERSFIIDTPYDKFEKMWNEYYVGEISEDSNNIEL